MSHSKSLVALQFILIILLLLLNESVFNSMITTILVILGIAFGGLTLVYNRLGNFNIRPDIKNNAKLITTGPYKYIRHPMYTSVMIIMISVVFTQINILNLILYAMLLIVLYKKAKKEETLWKEQNSLYEAYMKKTKMFFPYVI